MQTRLEREPRDHLLPQAMIPFASPRGEVQGGGVPGRWSPKDRLGREWDLVHSLPFSKRWEGHLESGYELLGSPGFLPTVEYLSQRGVWTLNPPVHTPLTQKRKSNPWNTQWSGELGPFLR